MMGKSKVRQHMLRHKKPCGAWGSEPTAPSFLSQTCSVDGKPGEMYSLQTDVKEMCGPRAWMDTVAGLQSVFVRVTFTPFSSDNIAHHESSPRLTSSKCTWLEGNACGLYISTTRTALAYQRA
ncbi:unnamed protein product [Pipistrellus nathusii]|uniref:Uncharacterized protein n=1 Tax=Pipistrellus nathusii TaxID=59473 RepID=A0ABN9ZW79_PIPNA